MSVKESLDSLTEAAKGMSGLNIHQLLGEHYPNGFILIALDESNTPILSSEYPSVGSALALQFFGKTYFSEKELQLRGIVKNDYLSGD